MANHTTQRTVKHAARTRDCIVPLPSFLTHMAKKKLVRFCNNRPSLTLSKMTIVIRLTVDLDKYLYSLLLIVPFYLRGSQLEMSTFPEATFKQKVWVQVILARHYFLLSDVPLSWGLRFYTTRL